MARIGRQVVVGVAVIVSVFVVLTVLGWAFQRQLIYLPDTSRPATPADVEEVVIATSDGLELDAWFLPAGDEPITTVLVTPGNAGNRALRLPLARGLVERGHAVFLLDYRGYGGNPGRPTEDGLIADARAAHRHLASRDDVDADRIAHLGESIGSAVAAAAAATEGPAALVLRSPFPALEDVARHHYGFLPVGLLLRDRFPTTERVSAYGGPTLVIAGGADTIVPTEMSRAVAAESDAELVEIPGVGHNDVALLDGAEYLDAVDEFLRSALG
jgi:fermentation-respiration switch protein FrsA (DUF1100 family)